MTNQKSKLLLIAAFSPYFNISSICKISSCKPNSTNTTSHTSTASQVVNTSFSKRYKTIKMNNCAYRNSTVIRVISFAGTS